MIWCIQWPDWGSPWGHAPLLPLHLGVGWACPWRDPQSVPLDLSYHKEHQCIWFRGGDLNSFWDTRPFMNPSGCHWMRLIIRNMNICGLGVGNWTVKLQAPVTLRLQSSLHFYSVSAFNLQTHMTLLSEGQESLSPGKSIMLAWGYLRQVVYILPSRVRMWAFCRCSSLVSSQVCEIDDATNTKLCVPNDYKCSWVTVNWYCIAWCNHNTKFCHSATLIVPNFSVEASLSVSYYTKRRGYTKRCYCACCIHSNPSRTVRNGFVIFSIENVWRFFLRWVYQ